MGGTIPSGVTVIQGEWPGIKIGDQATAGPTGVPWVDSNGWKIRLAAAREPGKAVWVDRAPPASGTRAEAYLTAMADAAVFGGRWIVSPDDQLAAGVASHRPEAVEAWQKLTAAEGFFAAHTAWAEYVPDAVIGIVSDFGDFFSNELLNLVARTGQQYRVMLKTGMASFSGLRAVLYADAEPPAPELRKRILVFVEAGGMLITGPGWGQPEGTPSHPRYTVRALGKGKIAVSTGPLDDPFQAANDAVVLMSHRYELLRFWNPGALGASMATTPDRKRSLVQLVFYATAREGDVSVRVARHCRAARLWTLDHPAARSVPVETERDGTMIHLPPVSIYAALELEA